MHKEHPALARLQHAFERLEASRKRMQRLAQAAPEATLNRRSASGGWSALQIIHHLNIAEAASCDYLEKKLQDPTRSKRAGVRAWVRFFLLYSSLLSPIKFTAPAITTENLPETSTLPEAIEAWAATRARLQRIISSIPPEFAKRELFKHPLAGRMSALHMLRFMNVHVRRHTAQLRRTLAA
jgi:uncharacterized damage-inducible protein DinB